MKVAKTEKEARQAYEADMRKILSCVADVNAITKWSDRFNCWILSTTLRGIDFEAIGSSDEITEFLTLRTDNGKKIYFEVDHQILVVKEQDGFRVSTRKYVYAIWETPEKDLFGWHYHPGNDGINFPHVHIHNDHLLQGMHIPSGRVSLEDVIRFLIIELKVSPDKRRKEDWEKVLAETGAKFEAIKTWGKKHPS